MPKGLPGEGGGGLLQKISKCGCLLLQSRQSSASFQGRDFSPDLKQVKFRNLVNILKCTMPAHNTVYTVYTVQYTQPISDTRAPDGTMCVSIKTHSSLAAVFIGWGKSSCMLVGTSNFVMTPFILFTPRTWKLSQQPLSHCYPSHCANW